MGKRDSYAMVPEDDPQWMRFWDAYPSRVSKKEARKAWAKLRPSLELVNQMLDTLAWQVPLWARQGYGTPYPASWLNGEKWTDERPGHARKATADINGHQPPCRTWTECTAKVLQEARDAKKAHAAEA